MKDTKIYSGFPGVGKTYMFNRYKNLQKEVIDSDSSEFDKSNFPDNYIFHIKSNIGLVDVILVSSHQEVRDALVREGIPFSLIYPKREAKLEYLARYRMRGSSENFLQLVRNNWDNWIDGCQNQIGCEHIVLPRLTYLNHVIY